MNQHLFFFIKDIKSKIIVTILVVAVIMVLINTDISNSVLGKLVGDFSKPDWNEVKERNIIKNTIPITILETSGQDCLVNAENFEYITSHNYFIRSQELANQLHYDEQNKTLMIPCDEIPEKTSELHVWYATEEALKHSKKYEYFVTTIEN